MWHIQNILCSLKVREPLKPTARLTIWFKFYQGLLYREKKNKPNQTKQKTWGHLYFFNTSHNHCSQKKGMNSVGYENKHCPQHPSLLPRHFCFLKNIGELDMQNGLILHLLLKHEYICHVCWFHSFLLLWTIYILCPFYHWVILGTISYDHVNKYGKNRDLIWEKFEKVSAGYML